MPISNDNAIGLAEREAEKYPEEADCEYIGLAQAYHLYNQNIENGSEIFSLIREHNNTSKKYLDRFFDTKYERQQDYKK